MKCLIRFLFIIFTFVNIAHANTETLQWYVDGNVYATTTCESGDDVSAPTPPLKTGYNFVGWYEFFNRGTFPTWNNVLAAPVNQYLTDTNGNNTPQQYDHIIVTDASDYRIKDMEIKIYWDGWGTHKFSVNDSALVQMNNVNTWTPFYLENDVIIYIKDFEPSYGRFGIKCNVDMLVNGSIVPAGNVVQFIESRDPRTVYYYVAGDLGLSGQWGFYYSGDWETDGVFGWKPESQIQNNQ